MELDAQLNRKVLTESKNIAEALSKEDITRIEQAVVNDFDCDLESRADWEIRNSKSLELALQITKQKTTPWIGAANVMFPLVTIAAMQCHAREYPALLSGTDLVKCRVIGEDPDGLKQAKARRVAMHMSYQILEEDLNWEDQMDRVMFTKPIVGTAFKKVYFDPILSHNVSEMVLAQNIVLPYYAKSLEKASRITHIIELSENDIYERVARGVFLDIIDTTQARDTNAPTPLQVVSDTVQGRHAVMGDSSAPVRFLEQHRYLDLDGDGYAEPYIVTVCEKSKQLVRIVARFFENDIVYKDDKNKVILSINPQHFFVKYGMIPSPDGGIYDLGFGSLLGPLNHTVNTLINQLLDAGTLGNLGGGFLGRGAKLRRGQNQFSPGEWKQVDGTGTDLKNSVVPLPTKEPSQVLFALLGMLVNYGERIAGATDIMTGQNVGQNTPAQTAQEMVKQGSVIFNGIFKRTYRSLKEEFRMLYRLNQLYITETATYTEMSASTTGIVTAEDYSGSVSSICPASDPNISSVEKRMQQAVFLKQAAMAGPGYNAMAVERRMLEAAQIPYLSEVWDENAPPPQPKPDAKLQIAAMKMQFEQQKLKTEMQFKVIELMQNAEKMQAEILELHAKAEKEIAEARGIDIGHKIAALQLEISAKKNRSEGIVQSIKMLKDLMDIKKSASEEGGDGGLPVQMLKRGVGSMATQPSESGGQEIPGALAGATEGGLV